MQPGTAKLGTGAAPCALLRFPRHAAQERKQLRAAIAGLIKPYPRCQPPLANHVPMTCP